METGEYPQIMIGIEMIDILGQRRESDVSGSLLEAIIKRLNFSGQFYHGFPVISSAEGAMTLDGLLCSEEHGVVIFHYLKEDVVTEELAEIVDEVHLKITAKLSEVRELTKNRSLAVPVKSIVYAPSGYNHEIGELEGDVLLSITEADIKENIQSSYWEHPELLRTVLSRLQSLSNLKPKRKRSYVRDADSKGAVLKSLERSLATLDANQTRAVLENIDGVQRIRGLAGSGKTIVLARKIAHIHSQNPDWNIAVTFNSRSLKEQLKRLVEIFYFDSDEDKPDWDKVNIIHAWGSPKSEGMYFNACLLHNVPYKDFSESKYLKTAREDNFQAVCRDFLDRIQSDKKLYDLILIDEAQDFKPEFLQLCYSLLDSKKRLIYAYDELQNLGDSAMPSPEEIWGSDENGKPKVSFTEQSQDIILDVCYRNPGPVLTAAHALGFGVYRKPMIQMFEYDELWKEIGYEVENGELAEGQEVTLKRSAESSPALLENHNSYEELIKFRAFDSVQEEYDWVVSEIIKNIREEEILPSDIVVIHPNTKRMRQEVGYIRDQLFNSDVNSSIAGITSSPDEFFSDDSITFTSIYRAKGNEAAMVYIINAEYCNTVFELAKKRNILFTAMTRTKAWLRVVGTGDRFAELVEEYSKVKHNNFALKFKYPTQEEREKMRIVNRDMTSSERRRVSQARKNAENLAALLGGEVNLEDIPEELRAALIQKLKG